MLIASQGAASLTTSNKMVIWWPPNASEWCDGLVSSELNDEGHQRHHHSEEPYVNDAHHHEASYWRLQMTLTNFWKFGDFKPEMWAKMVHCEIKWALLPSILLTFTLLRAIMFILSQNLLLFWLKTPKNVP